MVQAATVAVPPPADVVMADGRVATIRPVAATDQEALRSLHEHVSDQAFRLRFFAVGRAAGVSYVEHLFAAPDTVVAALVACVRGRVVALATAERLDATSAEIALLVADGMRGLGLGSLLVEHLAAQCRSAGVGHLIAEVLVENRAMLEVFSDAGFASSRRTEGSTVRLDLVTTLTPGAQEAADLRESHAEARSLAPILSPHQVAVVGVRRDGTGTGHALLESIRDGGFTGQLDVVHPAGGTVAGLPAYRSFRDVPGRIDLAVIAVPARAVLAALEDAVAAGVRGVVVVSSGFSELGPAGRDLQHALVRVARASGVRLIGPNCLGILSNDPEIRLNATFSRVEPPAGGLALASQSGGVGIALLALAAELGLGVRSFISLGNKADVSGNDLLAAWLDDPAVSAAALYLESFGNAPKFARIAARFSRRKPLLAVVGGRSAGGRRAGESHTAAAASPAVGIDALFAQAGVIACRGAEDMAETALLLATQPLPAGPRVAVLSNAGGMGVLAADVADGEGLVVPGFSADLRAALADHVSGTVGLANPVDIGAGGSPDELAACVRAVLTSGEVDAVLVILVATAMTEPAPMLEALAAAHRDAPEIPLLLTTLGMASPPEPVRGVTRLRSYEGALEALGRAAARTAWLQRPVEESGALDEDRARAVRARAEGLVTGGVPGGWLDAPQTAGLLEPYGLGQIGALVAGAAEAARAAEAVGYPLALKVADPAVQHKTDRGLIRIGLSGADQVRAVVAEFERELGRSPVPVLVQPMVSGVEVALGVVRDPSFGPLIRVAAGGTATNLLEDQTFLLPPVAARAAEDALGRLRIWPLLNGYRGAEPGAVAALVERIVALGALAHDLPELAELDLNPVVVTPTDAVVVDAKLRLAPATGRRTDEPRQLAANR